jgi:hypothetical protein
MTPILVGHETSPIKKVISVDFRAYIEYPKRRSYAIWRQFKYEVVLNSELDSNSVIPNWIGSPPSRARLLGSPAPF